MSTQFDRRLRVDTEYERTCTKCRHLLPIDAFYQSSTATKWWCKACTIASQKVALARRGAEGVAARKRTQKLSYERNREKACATGREYRNRPEVKEHRRQQAAVYRQRTREQRRAYLRQWYRDNPERARDTFRRGAAVRRARLQDVVRERFTYREIFERDGGRCRYCGVVLDPKNWHLDHIISISCGGPHARVNVCASCPTCNLRKRDKLMIEALLIRAPVSDEDVPT